MLLPKYGATEQSAMCAIANIENGTVNIYCNFFRFIIQMLTLNLSFSLPSTHEADYKFYLLSPAASKPNIFLREKKSCELLLFFLSASVQIFTITSLSLNAFFFKWNFNGCLNLQHLAKSHIAFAMHKWISLDGSFYAHRRFDYKICNANSIKSDFLWFFLCLLAF